MLLKWTKESRVLLRASDEVGCRFDVSHIERDVWLAVDGPFGRQHRGTLDECYAWCKRRVAEAKCVTESGRSL